MELGSENCATSIAVEQDEAISKEPSYGGDLCGEGPSKEVVAVRLDSMTQASLANVGGVEDGRASEVHKRCDLGPDPDLLDSREHTDEWRDEMEEGKHVPSWMAVEISSAASVPEKTMENLAASHNAPEKTLPSSRRRMFFMVRMPRASDSDLRSKIRLAELQLEEASKTRDVIRAALQLRRASKIGLLDKLKVARDKERACKDEFQKKRLEIDPLQTALNRLRLSDTKYKEDVIFSEEDLDNKIASLQHRIQHESIPLKEEKQLIREIKQLESQRSQVCANDAEHAHLLESYGPKENIQDQLEILYRELDVLRANQNQARLECKPIEKDLEDLNVKIDELVDQLEAAKHSQASALGACKELKKNLSEQNAEFYKYRDNFRKAKELASSKNVEALSAFCNDQVESMLRCWNNDSSFRERYIKNNVQSTLRRLETMDGRSLGIDEEPLLLISDAELAHETKPKDVESGSKRMGSRKETAAKSFASFAQENNVKGLQEVKAQQPQEEMLQEPSSSVPQKKEVVEVKKSGGKSSQSSSNNRPPSSLSSPPPVFTASAPIEDEATKEAQAAELKEKRREEEMAKAKEAAERKRRQAERAQAKAQLRAQKEAERREKERAKKAKKKAAVGVEDINTAETVEDREKELGAEELTKTSAKESPSGRNGKGFLGKQPRSQRQILNPVSRKNVWQRPPTWLWVSFIEGDEYKYSKRQLNAPSCQLDNTS
ncbi:hypothetical protein GOP47_0017298 [Adiantum capillus-veneris]|uniref:Uncharacterized protein n=1 Tax=Adiantum capillus-veneris TaxID=13818 RepID=A0A9D4UF63_ADICA|nr:hypothetical protein GOP47_0017298 [Adiantum capillus-veneris]